ncbi:MAG: signal recognition particle-docking protein FtsY [Firmicutes bacterium]|nr:signal recognition particle-docking protein FtsY [Bacillota bacterium]
MPAATEGFFSRLKAGLSKTKANLMAGLEGIFSGARKIDAGLYSDLEDTLIMADVGVETTGLLLERLKKTVKEEGLADSDQLKTALQKEMGQILAAAGSKTFEFTAKKVVYLIVGVNGVGKTTTIAKLGAGFKERGSQVLLVAADTFRAAATEQLMLWGERIGIPVIHHQEGADPAAVVFDGMAAAKARKTDVVLVDTAGRLHTKVNLMEELKKVRRVVMQNLEDFRLETLLVLDANTGQNAVNQAKIFHEALGVDGLILTKLDGTAKGGVILAIASQLKIPILLVGVGEKKEDLQPFDPQTFTKALFEED